MNYEAYHSPWGGISVSDFTLRAPDGIVQPIPDTYRYFHFRRWGGKIFDQQMYAMRHVLTYFNEKPNQRGGVTVAILRDPNGVTRGIGVAVCSDEDQFSRRTGREIARERARTAMQTGRMLVAPKCRRRVVEAVLGKFPVTRLLGL